MHLVIEEIHDFVTSEHKHILLVLRGYVEIRDLIITGSMVLRKASS